MCIRDRYQRRVHGMEMALQKINTEVELKLGVSKLMDTYILMIYVESSVEVKDHYEFEIVVTGRSRFAYFLKDPRAFTKFRFRERYSSLRQLHKLLRRTLPLTVSDAHENTRMPKFPGKAWFGSAKKRAERRVQQLNEYFEGMFFLFGSRASFLEELISFFSPKFVSIAIFGGSGAQQQQYMCSMVKEYVKRSEFIESVDTASTESGELRPTFVGSMLSCSECPEVTLEESKEIFCFKWQDKIPFDYKTREKLFRVEFTNLYCGEKENDLQLLCGSTHQIVLLDYKAPDVDLQAEKVLLMLQKSAVNSILLLGFNVEDPQAEEKLVKRCSRAVSSGVYVKYLNVNICLLYTSPSPRDLSTSRMPSSA
eukprot:TRINITY_DN59182_c0_g1_i1.p1 TRINITY_DN59182_c0_g1~~TRINITY_DN59182_c0_g1_i1.p1  ORF type:complete len:367 (-),score=60.80 TRINITY_DN59182_c0_g1_i1:45-1145(-)